MPKSISELAGRRRDPSLNLSCLQISFWSNLSFAPSQDLQCGHLVNITPPSKGGEKEVPQVEPKLK